METNITPYKNDGDSALPLDLPPGLAEQLRNLEEGFTPMLLRLIQEQGMTEVECYKRAHINRRQFSRIRCDLYYHPRKKTVIALAMALHLDLEETQALMQSAGYWLSDSLALDVVVMYAIRSGHYDLFELNHTLTKCDLKPLILD